MHLFFTWTSVSDCALSGRTALLISLLLLPLPEELVWRGNVLEMSSIKEASFLGSSTSRLFF